jgi:hypothetical protein
VASTAGATMQIDFKCVGNAGTFQLVYGDGTAKGKVATRRLSLYSIESDGAEALIGRR